MAEFIHLDHKLNMKMTIAIITSLIILLSLVSYLYIAKNIKDLKNSENLISGEKKPTKLTSRWSNLNETLTNEPDENPKTHFLNNLLKTSVPGPPNVVQCEEGICAHPPSSLYITLTNDIDSIFISYGLKELVIDKHKGTCFIVTNQTSTTELYRNCLLPNVPKEGMQISQLVNIEGSIGDIIKFETVCHIKECDFNWAFWSDIIPMNTNYD